MEFLLMSFLSEFGCWGYAVAGSVCASLLAAKGLAVKVFDSGRGPGGRMSQRRYVNRFIC